MTTDTTNAEGRASAYALGAEHATHAASWVLDGRHHADHYRRLIKMLEAGDPAVYDMLPVMPNLSGQWADDYTPATLAHEIDGDLDDQDALADAYERGVEETFETECERLLRGAVE